MNAQSLFASGRAPPEEANMDHAFRIERVGGPEVLRWIESDVGEPAPGEVRLRHEAVGLDYVDVYHRTGLYPVPLPSGLGMEGAGVVEAVGAGVSGLAPGDRVAYVGGPLGAYSERRRIPAERVVALPDGVEARVAAATMLRGLTVHFLLHRTHPVKAGDTVLLHAAAGGLGLLFCQWARALGVRVIGTVSTEEKAALAAAHGCTFPLVRGRDDVVARVREITGGEGVPVVYDSVGRTTFASSIECLRPLGLLVSFGQASGPVPPVDLSELGAKGSLFVTRPSIRHYTAQRDDYVAGARAVFDAMSAGILRPEVTRAFALREAPEAHRLLERGGTTGAMVLVP
jgi:NADPH2:quinone reductase